MPSVKQGGGYTLTFAKKNQDVKEHLDTLKQNKVIITDYLCEAVRFYENHKNDNTNSNNISNMDIERLIEEKIKDMLGNNSVTFLEKASNVEESANNLENGIDKLEESDLDED